MLFTLYSIYIGKFYGMCVCVLYCITLPQDVSFSSSSYSIFVCSFVRSTQKNNSVRLARQETSREQNTADRSKNGLCSPISIDDCYHANMIHGLSTLSTTLYKFPVCMHGMACHPFAVDALFLLSPKTKKETHTKNPVQRKQCATELSKCHVHVHTHTVLYARHR